MTGCLLLTADAAVIVVGALLLAFVAIGVAWIVFFALMRTGTLRWI